MGYSLKSAAAEGIENTLLIRYFYQLVKQFVPSTRLTSSSFASLSDFNADHSRGRGGGLAGRGKVRRPKGAQFPYTHISQFMGPVHR